MADFRICPHFKSCGGCDLQDIPYSEQLLLKQKELSRVLGRDVFVNPSPDVTGYRSRMDFICSDAGLGLRAKGDSRKIVPVTNCNLMSEKANELFSKVNSLLRRSGLSVYDLHSKKGFLRYVTIREARSTGQMMLIFTTGEPSSEDEASFRGLLDSLASSVDSIHWFVHTGVSDDAVVGEDCLVIGNPEIVETLLGKDFLISPKTFFQSNLSVAEKMFSSIKKNISGSVLELYCGVGVIAISVADSASSVTAVEKNPDSIIAAKKNAKINDVEIDFIASDSLDLVREVIKQGRTFDTIIVDPPRTGLGTDVIMGLRALNPEKVIYMSCNPKTLRNDLAMLSGYRVLSLEAYDMFPQTHHVECLAVLER